MSPASRHRTSGCLGFVFPMANTNADEDQSTDGLRAEIERAREFLSEFVVRPGHRAIDHALARYFWLAIQTAEVIELACTAAHPAGTAPLRRFLFETLLDIHLLVSSDSPDLDAVKSMVWDVLDWDSIWDRHEAAVAVDPTLSTGRSQNETVDEAVDRLRVELESLGEDVTLLDQAAEAARNARHPHWHWSDHGPAGRISELASRTAEDSSGEDIVAMYRDLWKVLSSSAHPSPAWRRLKITELADGGVSFPDITTGGDPSASNAAKTTANTLEMYRSLISHFRT